MQDFVQAAAMGVVGLICNFAVIALSLRSMLH
jgi:hypothetical protein